MVDDLGRRRGFGAFSVRVGISVVSFDATICESASHAACLVLLACLFHFIYQITFVVIIFFNYQLVIW